MSTAGPDQVLVCNTAGRLFIRWFATADGIAALLRNRKREDDDVVSIDVGTLRIELSLHDSPAAARRAADGVKQKAALLMRPAKGVA
jgi:hypothetical protein